MNTLSNTSIPFPGSSPTFQVEKQLPSEKSWAEYLWTDTRVYSLLMLGIMCVEFTIFKLLYPFPDFFSDSYSYIYAAYAHLDVNIWPIGYSRFLSLFHWFSHSGSALVYFQYFTFAFSALYFYHTIVYFYPTGKNTRIVLCLFFFFNPLFFYVANYVTSDMLFISMSLVWITLMIWILNRPRLYMIFIQAVLMFVMFTFRYNAMIYPAIATAVLILSKQKVWVKVVGILSGPVLIAPFILFSAQAAKKMTGTPQFPPILGGWQWGNNALYFREFISPDTVKFPTAETAELDRIARRFYATVPYEKRDLPNYVANFFIRQPNAPLKQYMNRHYQPKDAYEDIVAWGKAAVVFDTYGKYLVKHYPFAFIQHYMLVNAKNYFIPPLEKLEIYNLGEDEMWPMAKLWFQYPSAKVSSISKDLQGVLLAIFPFLFLFLNIFYGIGIYLFIRRGGIRSTEKEYTLLISIISLFLVLNAGFSIFANIIVIRYEIFPMIIFLAFAMLTTDQLELLGEKSNKTTVHQVI